jgi:hypothetical protein
VRKLFNIQKLLHHKSKLHGTKPMHPSSLLRAFQRHQEHNLKHPGVVDLITIKQNKTNYLPSWIDNDVKGKRAKRWLKEREEKLNWISCRRRFRNWSLPDFQPLPSAYQHRDETSNLENTEAYFPATP